MKSRHNIEICYKVQIWRVSYSIVHRNNIYFWGSCRYVAIMCRKIAFFGLRAEIILSSDKVSLDSRAGPFLGVCRNIGFTEKYSPLHSAPPLARVKYISRMVTALCIDCKTALAL